MPESRKALAYLDENTTDLRRPPRSGARYLMRPSPFAKLVQLAEIGPADKVLDVGTGTGYSAAILSRLAKSVVALEAMDSLADKAERRRSPASATTMSRSCAVSSKAGHKAGAPYDVIIVEGSVEELPEALTERSSPRAGGWSWSKGNGNAGAVARIYLKSNGVATGRRAFNAAAKATTGI